MAKIGARYGKIAPITDPGSSSALPTYGAALKPGPLNKVEDSPTYNEGELYGDDSIQDNYAEFTKGTLTIDFTSVTDDAEKIMSPYSYDEDGDGALVPGGNKTEYGFGHVSAKRGKENGQSYTKYYGIFYPRLSPKYDGATVETQGGTTTLNPESIPANWLKPVGGEPKYVSKYFDTVTEAEAWVDAKLPDTVS